MSEPTTNAPVTETMPRPHWIVLTSNATFPASGHFPRRQMWALGLVNNKGKSTTFSPDSTLADIDMSLLLVHQFRAERFKSRITTDEEETTAMQAHLKSIVEHLNLYENQVRKTENVPYLEHQTDDMDLAAWVKQRPGQFDTPGSRVYDDQNARDGDCLFRSSHEGSNDLSEKGIDALREAQYLALSPESSTHSDESKFPTWVPAREIRKFSYQTLGTTSDAQCADVTVQAQSEGNAAQTAVQRRDLEELLNCAFGGPSPDARNEGLSSDSRPAPAASSQPAGTASQPSQMLEVPDADNPQSATPAVPSQQSVMVSQPAQMEVVDADDSESRRSSMCCGASCNVI